MEQYKQEFINFMVQCDVLKFGEFTLKSGRKSPFFMNAGAYVTEDKRSVFRVGKSAKNHNPSFTSYVAQFLQTSGSQSP